jgi:hypothetical protein
MNKIKIILFSILYLFMNSCNSSGQNKSGDKIIFKDANGNQISMSDLKGVTGNYNWEIKDDIEIPDEANELHQEARQHGGKGEYDLGIEKLKKANKIAPKWAYPIYDLAYTYLLKQDFPNALKYYELTDKMKPKGFFTTKTAHWSLKKEKEGDFQEGLYLAFMQIEWMDTDEEKLQIAKAITDKFPKYAPAWKIISQKANDNKERLDAVENGLNSNPDEDTKGVLLINKALVKNIQEKQEEAKNILGKLIFDKDSTFGNIELAKYVLSTIANKE